MIRRAPNPYGEHFWGLLGALVALLLVWSSGHADTGKGPGHYWVANYSCDTTSMAATLACGIAWKNANTSGCIEGNDAFVYAGPTYTGIVSGEYRWNVSWACIRNSDGATYFIDPQVVRLNVLDTCTGGTINTTTGECELAPTCETPAGTENFYSGPGTAPGSLCVDGCSYTPSGGVSVSISGYFGASYVTEGGSCTGTEDADPDPEDLGLNCIFDGTQEFCADTNSTENCGTLNGEYVCLDDVPPGNCLLTASGQAICDGTIPGATPTGTIDNGDGPFNVYGDGAGGASGTQTGTDNGNANDQGSGTGEGDGEGSTVETPGIDDDGCDFGCISQAFYNDLAGGPIASAVNVSLASGSSTCPAPSFAIFGTTFTIDAHCTLGESVRALLQLVMLGVWAFVGTRIVLKA